MDRIDERVNWEPVKGHIMTRWAKEVSPENPLPEYPRPQMVRDRWMNLNGLWEYAIVSREQQEVKVYDGNILVPYPIESALSGVKRPLLPSERLHYRRTFKQPEAWSGERLLLHFGAVDWEAKVYVNGIQAGSHTGGYYPFTFEITDLIGEGENEIEVSVWDPTDDFGQERGKQALKPGGIFYTPVSGIWQTVWLESVPTAFIKSIRLNPDIDEEVLIIETSIDGNMEGLHIEASAYDSDTLVSCAKGDIGTALTMKIPSPKLWSPDSPFLYKLDIRLMDDDRPLDTVKSYFGMRKISTAKDVNGYTRLFLNNKPLFMSGLLDQGYWPDGLYTAPTDEALQSDISAAKKLGFNLLRKHIKVEPARWYYYCDLMGMLVWQDMPNGGNGFSYLYHLLLPLIGVNIKDSTPSAYKKFGRQNTLRRENYNKELKEMIDALHNSPSIIAWVPFNECWGQFDAFKISSWVKAYDPSRLVDHASGWYDQHGGDFKSIHTYIRKLRIKGEPDRQAFVISEFGGYGFLEKGHVWNENKQVVYIKFKTKEDLSSAYKSLAEKQVMPLISRGLCACIYTQLTDVETEVNGLLTYDREILKIDEAAVQGANMDMYSNFDAKTQSPA